MAHKYMTGIKGVNIMNNPLLADFDKIPGFSITLPTNALIYDETVVSSDVLSSGEVHVRPMSIKDELALKTPDLLISGDGISYVVKRCVDGVIDPMKLSMGDINAILIALRIATFGEHMPIRATNPFYDESKEGSSKRIDFDIDLKYCLVNAKTISEVDGYAVTLSNEQVVKLRPLTFKESIEYLKKDLHGNIDNLETDEERSAYVKQKLNDMFLSGIKMISSVTTKSGEVITDIGMIADWYENLPSVIYEALKDKLNEVNDVGPEMAIEVTDPISKKKWKVTIPVNPTDFFTNGAKNKIKIN